MFEAPKRTCTVFVLRPYQEEAVSRAVAHLKSKVTMPGLIVLPTGAGKSLVIANIVQRLNGPVLVFQPSKEILEQNLHKYISYGGHAGVYSAASNRKELGYVTFATIGSVYRKASLFSQFDYFIIDECHKVNPEKGMYKQFIEELSTHNVIGLTATPYRLAPNSRGSELRFLTRTRPSVFKTLLYAVQTRQLFKEGFLCPLEYYQLQNFDRSQLQRNKSGTDYTDESMRTYYGAIDFFGGIVKVVARLLERQDRRAILVFTKFVEEAEILAARIQGAVVVSGDTPKHERENILRDFKRGKIKVVCNVGVLTIGFDYPELDTLVIARPTLSLALYYQMIGRALRPHKSKEKAMIIDMCGNIDFFGKIEDIEVVDADTRKPYVRGTYGQLTNVTLKRDVSHPGKQ